ncbi:hypothetical protein M405DRAFT_867675 [Rhizopogon salebrosus TDB-379]|nr:hypothetical protein M405DRAFT_867675 [Rhizopogon salebrosus TDB-379]
MSGDVQPISSAHLDYPLFDDALDSVHMRRRHSRNQHLALQSSTTGGTYPTSSAQRFALPSLSVRRRRINGTPFNSSSPRYLRIIGKATGAAEIQEGVLKLSRISQLTSSSRCVRASGDPVPRPLVLSNPIHVDASVKMTLCLLDVLPVSQTPNPLQTLVARLGMEQPSPF